MFSRKWALVAVFMVQLLYGLNYTFAKTVINDGFVGAFGFVALRVVGASLLFWLLGLFLPKEKILVQLQKSKITGKDSKIEPI